MLETASVPGGDSNDSRPVGRAEVVAAALEAASRLFAERSPSQVSVRDIAAQAGVSHALVHRYLGTKDDILRTVLARNRQAAADYWIDRHGHGAPGAAFEHDGPPGRYVRTVMRASLDGVELGADDLRLPHAESMLELLNSRDLPAAENDRGFDVRLLFAATTAMAAGMGVAEEFFLVQAGLEGEGRETIRAEFSRLIARIMTLAEKTNPDAAD